MDNLKIISTYEMPLWKDGPSEKDLDRIRNQWWNEYLKQLLEKHEQDGPSS